MKSWVILTLLSLCATIAYAQPQNQGYGITALKACDKDLATTTQTTASVRMFIHRGEIKVVWTSTKPIEHVTFMITNSETQLMQMFLWADTLNVCTSGCFQTQDIKLEHSIWHPSAAQQNYRINVVFWGEGVEKGCLTGTIYDPRTIRP